MKGIFKEIDGNANQQLEYHEFIAAAIDPKLLNNDQMLYGLFKEFDIDDSGQITTKEIHTAFSKFGQEITEAEIKAIMRAHDQDKDG